MFFVDTLRNPKWTPCILGCGGKQLGSSLQFFFLLAASLLQAQQNIHILRTFQNKTPIWPSKLRHAFPRTFGAAGFKRAGGCVHVCVITSRDQPTAPSESKGSCPQSTGACFVSHTKAAPWAAPWEVCKGSTFLTPQMFQLACGHQQPGAYISFKSYVKHVHHTVHGCEKKEKRKQNMVEAIVGWYLRWNRNIRWCLM